ncbi:MAG: hypothetical protein QOF85_266 [Solirubrobacterales bacterium]|nr:hypothetical protein [Solirubrobacterales bacterium]
MIRRKQVVSLLAGGALSLGAVFAANAMASPSGGFTLTGVPSANTRSDGYAPASKLSPELSQTIVAQGGTRMENSSPLTSFYGYDNDVLNAAGNPQMVPFAGNGGFGNDGDNEITGLFVSDGDTGTDGILGEEVPNLESRKWRWFYTQQHGDNRTYEVVVKHGHDE